MSAHNTKCHECGSTMAGAKCPWCDLAMEHEMVPCESMIRLGLVKTACHDCTTAIMEGISLATMVAYKKQVDHRDDEE